MKKTFTNLLGAMLLALSTSVAHADCSGGQCASVYIDQLYMETSGNAWIRTSGIETALNCTADSGVYLFLNGSTAGFKTIYATLLAAQLSGLLVNIRITDGSNPCSVVYVTLDRQ